MTADGDNYEDYYSDKLWNLIPTVYRFQDTDSFDHPGPLRELVIRIGKQAAILRRSTDRLWEDQSIEACDDWVIPYIADLLDVQLVNGLGTREQRLNVAKTIYYRRRKGTVAVLEELASDITGWNVIAVEFFRHLGRTRHGLDPKIGLAAENSFDDKLTFLEEQKLIGRLTRKACGGFADLRSPYSTSKTGTAFDEYFYSTDLRRGMGKSGWYNISHLGVFLWRLYSVSAGLRFDRSGPAKAGVTPVKSNSSSGTFSVLSFDPTGRKIPLFAAASHPFGDTWISPEEWRLPTPISLGLLKHDFANLYAEVLSTGDSIIDYHSLGLLDGSGNLVDRDAIEFDKAEFIKPSNTSKVFFIDPVQGIVFCKGSAPKDLSVFYHYGFASLIGAGEYDRTSFTNQLSVEPLGDIKVFGGKNALSSQLATLASKGTLTIEDSFTYDEVRNVIGIQNVLLRSFNTCRPLIRLPEVSATSRYEWVLEGDKGAELTLDGLFISGGDVVLKGNFKSVTLISCTFDPGTRTQDRIDYELSVDDRKLAPSCLWIEGNVQKLVISRCVMAPINERANGLVDELKINDSILQAIGPDPVFRMSLGILKMQSCTVIGGGNVHRLEATDCLLTDKLDVMDNQNGCIRFSAWATGSRLPRRYECVEIPPQAPIFVSPNFGHSAYAQVIEGVDKMIIGSDSGETISEGAENGSEMGAFSKEQYPIKMRALTMKYQEYMPIGLAPIFVNVT